MIAQVETNYLNPLQQRTLREIKQFIATHRYPPTIVELAGALHVATSTAGRYVNQLQRLGYVTRHPRTPRSLVVMRDDDATYFTGHDYTCFAVMADFDGLLEIV